MKPKIRGGILAIRIDAKLRTRGGILSIRIDDKLRTLDVCTVMIGGGEIYGAVGDGKRNRLAYDTAVAAAFEYYLPMNFGAMVPSPTHKMNGHCTNTRSRKWWLGYLP